MTIISHLVVEIYFRWMDIKILRLVRLYDKNTPSMIHISAISLISVFKMDFFYIASPK